MGLSCGQELTSLLGLILLIACKIAELGAKGERDLKPNGAFLRSGKLCSIKSLMTLHNLSADPLAPKIESVVSIFRISLHVSPTTNQPPIRPNISANIWLMRMF
jgi:hypothetical protein